MASRPASGSFLYERESLEGVHWNNAHLLQDVNDQYAAGKDGTPYGEPLVWRRLDVIGCGGH